MEKQRSTGPGRGSDRTLFAGLFAAAFTAISISLLPGIRFSSWISLLTGAAWRVLLVFLAAFISSLGIYRNGTAPRSSGSALKPALIAVWLAPLAFLARQNSIWMPAVVGIFVVTAGIALWPIREPAEQSSAPTTSAELFTLLEPPGWSGQAAVFGAILCAEAGAMMGFSRHLLPGTILVMLASGVWLSAFRENWKLRSDEFPARRAVAVAAFAILFTAIGLLPFLRRGYPGGSGTGRFTTQSRHRRAQNAARNREDGYIAIELWPEQRPTRLVAAIPVRKRAAAGEKSSPVVIPFSGVYWFFKSPNLSLPSKPREAHGSPEMFDIHSTDRRPLSMQAHQNLGALVDLSCCQSIRIGIRNSDRYPGSVSIELVLADTTSAGRPSVSLGRKSVRSTRPWMLDEGRPPTTEVLEYAVPGNSRIHRFDEVIVIFWLGQDRSFAAAKMSIENFVLVPHGA